MSRNQAKKVVQNFVKQLRKDRFPFERVYLFGSFAKNLQTKWSDIDVCVVSSKFAGKQWDEFERKLWISRRAIDSRIEPIGITARELRGSSPLAAEIKETGVRVV